jgi:hypothetical protein
MGTKWREVSPIARLLGQLAMVATAVMSMTAPALASAPFHEDECPVGQISESGSQDDWPTDINVPRVLVAARAELDIAGRILQAEPLTGCDEFDDYLVTLGSVLPAADGPLTPAAVRDLAVGLATARALLEGAAPNARYWLALFRASHPDHAGPVSVPKRFVARRASVADPPLRFDRGALSLRRTILAFAESSDVDSSSSKRGHAPTTG